MTASIFEHSDVASTVTVTWGTDEPHVIDFIEGDSTEGLGQAEFEASLGNAVFSYELLGEPDGDDEEIPNHFSLEDEFAQSFL